MSLNHFQSALFAELASQGLSPQVHNGGDPLVVRTVKAAALHTLLALYPPLRTDAGTVIFLQTAHSSARTVLEDAFSLAAAHIELLEHGFDVTPMMRRAGFPAHPHLPVAPSHLRPPPQHPLAAGQRFPLASFPSLVPAPRPTPPPVRPPQPTAPHAPPLGVLPWSAIEPNLDHKKEEPLWPKWSWRG